MNINDIINGKVNESDINNASESDESNLPCLPKVNY